MTPDPKTFSGWGYGRSVAPACAGVHMRTHRRACAGVASAFKTPLIFCHFRHGFATMAGMAQGLEVAAVNKPGPDATVWHDVVNVRCPNTHQIRQSFPDGPPSTFPAERLPQKLRRPEIIRPDRQRVPGVPVCRFRASTLAILWLVLATVASPYQFRASRMCTRTERFQSHKITSEKTKRRPG